MKLYPYGHKATDEDGITFDNPWMWTDDEEVTDQWRQGTGTDLTPHD